MAIKLYDSPGPGSRSKSAKRIRKALAASAMKDGIPGWKRQNMASSIRYLRSQGTKLDASGKHYGSNIRSFMSSRGKHAMGLAQRFRRSGQDTALLGCHGKPGGHAGHGK